MELKSIFEQAAGEASFGGNITINKKFPGIEDILEFTKRQIEKILGASKKGGEEDVKKEVTPPGKESQVRKLKKVLPKTYKPKGSKKRKKSSPWAVAWAQHKRKKKKGLKEIRYIAEQESGESVSKVVPGKVPNEPKSKPQLFGPEIKTLTTPYFNVKVSNYQMEWRERRNPDGTILIELVVWQSSGGKEPSKLTFVESVVMTLSDNTVTSTQLRHFRWQLGQFLKERESMPEPEETPEKEPAEEEPEVGGAEGLEEK